MNASPIILTVLLASLVTRADQVKEGDFAAITIGARTFTNAHLRAYSAEYGSLRYDGGIEKVKLADLPEPARAKFYNPELAKPPEAKVSPQKRELITNEYATRINAFAEKADMTVEEAMRWDYVLIKRGLSLADFDQALTKVDQARDKALGYHPDIAKRNANGRRLKAGDPHQEQRPELSKKEEDIVKMLKLAGYP